jgi:hypothetical protein
MGENMQTDPGMVFRLIPRPLPKINNNDPIDREALCHALAEQANKILGRNASSLEKNFSGNCSHPPVAFKQKRLSLRGREAFGRGNPVLFE